jgi:hypothetical protein
MDKMESNPTSDWKFFLLLPVARLVDQFFQTVVDVFDNIFGNSRSY